MFNHAIPSIFFRFGKAKMSDPVLVQILVQVITRFDVILIEEVVDSSGKAVDLLLKEINSGSEYLGKLKKITITDSAFYLIPHNFSKC